MYNWRSLNEFMRFSARQPWGSALLDTTKLLNERLAQKRINNFAFEYIGPFAFNV